MNPVITSAKSFGKVLAYNFRKVEQGQGEVLYAQNIAPNSLEEAMASLQPYEEMKTRTKNRVFSCSLNPHPDDKVSDELYVKIANEFMEEMGYGEQPFIVFKHTDIERHHIHIISSRIDWTGKKIKDSYEKEKARRIADRLERKYGLKLTGKYQTVHDENLRPLKPIDPKEGNLQKQMGSVVLQLLPDLYFQSLGELNCLLAKYNITTEATKTEYNGKYYDGVVFFVTDSNGNKISPPMKGSELGRGCGIYALRNKMKKSKDHIALKTPAIRMVSREALRGNPESIDEYKQRLGRFGISLVIRQNSEGRIYGVTYVDEKEGIAVNGSRLGKEYSANALNALYGTGPQLSPQRHHELHSLGHSTISNLLEDIVDSAPARAYWTGEDEGTERRFQNRLKREERKRRRKKKSLK